MYKKSLYEISRGFDVGLFSSSLNSIFENFSFDTEISILEYGCGAGNFANDVINSIPLSSFITYVGIDNNIQQLNYFKQRKIEREKLNISLLYEDANKYKHDEQFDLIIFSGFQHKANNWFDLLESLKTKSSILIVYRTDDWIKKVFNQISFDLNILEDRLLRDYFDYRNELDCNYPNVEYEKLKFITEPKLTDDFLSNKYLIKKTVCCSWQQHYKIVDLLHYIKKQVHTSFEHISQEKNGLISEKLYQTYKSYLQKTIDINNKYQINLYEIK